MAVSLINDATKGPSPLLTLLELSPPTDNRLFATLTPAARVTIQRSKRSLVFYGFRTLIFGARTGSVLAFPFRDGGAKYVPPIALLEVLRRHTDSGGLLWNRDGFRDSIANVGPCRLDSVDSFSGAARYRR